MSKDIKNLMQERYKTARKDFRLVFGDSRHILIAKGMGELEDKQKKLLDTERSLHYITKMKEEIASIQSNLIYLINESKKI